MLGTGAAGLTQYAAIVAAVVIGLVANGPISEQLGGPAACRSGFPS